MKRSSRSSTGDEQQIATYGGDISQDSEELERAKFLALCINTGTIHKTQAETDMSSVKSDAIAFSMQKDQYLKTRGIRSRFNFLIEPITIELIQFTLWNLQGGYISVCDRLNCIPPDNCHNYEFSRPPIRHPSMPPEIFIHYLNHDKGDLNPIRNDWLPRLPKRKDKRVIDCGEACLGWRMHMIEGPNREVIFSIMMITILASILTGILWATLRNDVQGGNLDGTDSLLRAERGVCSQLPISPADNFVTTTSNLPVTRPQQYSNTELLLQAALDGDTEAVRRLFTAGADLASYRHQAEYMKEESKKIHILYPHTDYKRDALEGTTALHLAAYGGHFEVVKLLIHAGADVFAFDFPGLTALHWAAYKGHQDIVALLLENGANPSSLPYHLMDTLGDPTAKGSFWTGGADLHMEGLGTPHTALEAAAGRGNGESIKLLRNSGAHASQRALNLAVSSAHTEAARILLDAGVTASLPDPSGLLPLNRAASLGHETIVRLLLEARADINLVDVTGESALHLAASGGHSSVVQLLINAGASTTSLDERGMTPLHHASQGGNLRAVQLLLDHNSISESHQDFNQLTALHSAANCGNVEAFSELLDAFENADALATSAPMPIFHLSFGQVVERKQIVHTGPLLHHAAYGGSQQILSILLEREVDITAIDDHGMTALHWAVQGGRTATAAATIQQLLDAGVDLFARDNCGRTALNWASFPPRFDELLRREEGSAIAPVITPTHMSSLTSLHVAARNGQQIEIGDLISEGIDPSLPDGTATPRGGS
ncbi:ankyrin repeat domain-containing protein 44 [Penicillium waksmanii]|uniref:ankyrin repeat domain-containing protein 44 n=1 Tax=Penicillium waksmanii TaxID=69791 RepID=UPI0025488F15|nr:ankyrin repeat domain-containing protein 44 [Penicillium waksmanii]KAJ5975033.1 ankyrin repeat domain-containing protein 44 [Penicillium waksmanii]